MSDLFHAEVPIEFVSDIFEVIHATPVHTFQVLTKRPERAVRHADRLHDYARRIDQLRRIPAAVRFLSCEPMLGPLKLDLTDIDWVICGGKSGPGYRPMNPEWARGVRDQCLAAGVPFFFKQWGGPKPKSGGRTLDGREWSEFPHVAT